MYQKIIVAGNLGRDPEMRYLTDGTAVTSLNVAANRRWTDRASGQPRDETAWFRVSVWGRRAEVVHQYLSKGSAVLIEGRLQVDPQTGGPRLYTRQDGTVGASFEIHADNVTFLGGRGDGGGSTYSEGGFEGSRVAEEEDDIPF